MSADTEHRTATAANPAVRALWSHPVSDVRLVDARRSEALVKAGIETVEDLIRHYPFRYLDLSMAGAIRDVPLGDDATVVGIVRDVRVKRPRQRLTITEIAIADDTGVVVGVWFNQPYVAQRIKVDDRVAMAGRLELDYGLKQMKTPFLERLDAEDGPTQLGRILPVHRATEGVSPNWMRRLVLEALELAGDVPDPLPAALLVKRALPSLRNSLRAIHFPEALSEADAARRRLAYEEFFTLQLAMALRRHRAVAESPGHAHQVEGERIDALKRELPFTLTADQTSALTEVLADMSASRPMNRMLLGDVGTGKTAVAAFALASVADSGTQAAMMAPTEVLAAQYAGKVGPLLDAIGVRWCLLTGSTSAVDRKASLTALADGSMTVAFGTHALIQEDVTYKHLTLAIVDEQHRFGVQQRLALRHKGEAADLLVMTATPIPRSLALTLYGDLDTSYLRERPGDRGPEHIRTRLVNKTHRAAAYDVVRTAVAAGRQAYVVCALVDESDAAEARAATREAERLRTQVFPDLRVGLLTGKMRPAEKSAVMDSFRSGDVDILVSTTVIEVGVDVPNATVMIVEDAERFGLAQLHQLRGRIGRGEHAGEFLIFADPRTDEGRQRMKAIASTNDGFALAEEDLKLRGEGELLGQRQSGLPKLRLASLVDDAALLDMARDDARDIIERDPHLELPEHTLIATEAWAILGEDETWVRSG
ncbi:MAG: ATP-dependent DNA helicase RecG [Actinobacteria bacterium HGW-Actinobacteria-1]|jgi:ATP-dependent DNA helicase RecG|nr:MAG: ATP-dependent DNA helicase RecG [Actinobacteria bacterium HGW-Actinobacteria-1]